MNRVNKILARNPKKVGNKDILLGQLISELLKIFPNAMPEDFLIEKAIELELDEKYVKDIISKLNERGLVIITKDDSNKSKKKILKFPSIPFKFGKLYITNTNKTK